jgi:hypothetical protein
MALNETRYEKANKTLREELQIDAKSVRVHRIGRRSLKDSQLKLTAIKIRQFQERKTIVVEDVAGFTNITA